jgi:pyrimidine oxygenase
VDLGVFIPIGNNGWLISANSPQYMPSYDLNREIVQRAEGIGFDFALSMIKLRGFGGKTEFWDHNLESFTLMAGIAPVTERIKLYASTATLTLPPAIVARMAVTIDSMAPGRFGVNIVSGWQAAEYQQMGLWPGDEHFGRRYDHSTEYVQIMRDLWETGVSDRKGDFFQMDDCRLGPLPSNPIEVVCAGQSDRGMQFCAELGDVQFMLCPGVNNPTGHAEANARLLEAGARTGRDIGSYVLLMVIADETDAAAMATWRSYNDGVDVDALAWMADQAAADTTAGAEGTARTISLPEGAINFNMGTIVGSYEHVAAQLDEAAAVPGTKGIMLVFDDFLLGLEAFGERIQPLMSSRADRVASAA